MSRPIKTLYKVKIFVNNIFISYGEFVKENEYFSLISNYKVFDGHYNGDLIGFDYIFTFGSYKEFAGKTFDKIVKKINDENTSGFYDENIDCCVHPVFFLIKKAEIKFDKIEL